MATLYLSGGGLGRSAHAWPEALRWLAAQPGALLLASIAAYELGIRRGRAIGWIEHYESCVARDRSRRQRNGQFKAKEAAR